MSNFIIKPIWVFCVFLITESLNVFDWYSTLNISELVKYNIFMKMNTYKTSDPFQNGGRLHIGWLSSDHAQAIKIEVLQLLFASKLVFNTSLYKQT